MNLARVEDYTESARLGIECDPTGEVLQFHVCEVVHICLLGDSMWRTYKTFRLTALRVFGRFVTG